MKRIVSAALVATLMAGTALAQPPERGGRGEGPRAERGGGGGDRGQRQEQRQQRQEQRQQRQAQPERQEQRQQRQEQRQRPQPQVQRAQAEQPPALQGGPQPGRGSYLRSPEDRRQEYRGGDPRQPNRVERRDDRQDYRQDNRADRRDNRQDYRADRRDDRQDNRNWQNNRPGPGQQWGNQRGYQYRDRDRGRPQFDQRRYRPSYRAPQRFRIAPYRAPPGFYVRSWSFGDRLPYGWYSAPYYLNWVAYGLPMPPIGAEWVRVGSDALLVDVWSGQVLSVFYGLFW